MDIEARNQKLRTENEALMTLLGLLRAQQPAPVNLMNEYHSLLALPSPLALVPPFILPSPVPAPAPLPLPGISIAHLLPATGSALLADNAATANLGRLLASL
jgi:hypothetical protein